MSILFAFWILKKSYNLYSDMQTESNSAILFWVRDYISAAEEHELTPYTHHTRIISPFCCCLAARCLGAGLRMCNDILVSG